MKCSICMSKLEDDFEVALGYHLICHINQRKEDDEREAELDRCAEQAYDYLNSIGY